ncbi:hypothetical protein CMI37_10150 [Candidatus Pacearchaeota archaeon]|nr:hypothetical protein [Candidatus Pacearchaeota archaeon]|tara:strand:+ start:66 stop:398 length:333 start_codon:yes stop_codon:yes gene_type:complete
MEGNSVNLKDVISFQIHRNIVCLYKRYFEITEDLLNEHKSFTSKIESRLTNLGVDIEEINIGEIDYFTDKKFSQIRKKILDVGNDATRELERTLEFVTINLKEQENERTE